MKPTITLFTALRTPLAVSQAADTKRPNILIVINDDQSWLECSAYGNSFVQTPQFDRVAKAGVLFTHGYCSAPSCAPSRAALITGRNFWELEQGAFIQAWLPAKFATLPERLEGAGYHAGCTGKGWGPGVKEPTGKRSDPMGRVWNNARLEAFQRQTHDPCITGDMAIFAETLKFVAGRKASGYADSAAHKSKATKKGPETK